MLKKKERLNRQDFNRFFSTGKRDQTPLFTVVYSPFESFHAAVVVPKKIEKLAVKRNKTRRRIYDIIRRYKDKHDTRGVFIFILKKNLTNQPGAPLKEEVEKCIKRTQQ